jgi:dihydroxyacetone kinase-like protein
LSIVRNYVGNYCTSLEMAGASLTLLKLDKEIEDLLAAPADIAVRVF